MTVLSKSVSLPSSMSLSKKVLWGFVAAIVLQLAVLIGMTMMAAMPQWTGQEVRIKTVPVDPRSLFRGNYARLRYDLSRVRPNSIPEYKKLRHGEMVYAVLEVSGNQLYRLKEFVIERPNSGVYIRGRIDRPVFIEEVEWVQVKYGIEAFFAPKEKALALEHELRDGGIAVLMVSPGGKALLMDVEGEELID